MQHAEMPCHVSGRTLRECREDANLDRGVGLRAGRDRSEAVEAGGLALHIDAGIFGDSI